MTKYYYTCEEDKKLIEKIFCNIAFIIFEQQNSDKKINVGRIQASTLIPPKNM